MNKILLRLFIFSTLIALLGGIQIQAADWKYNDIPLKTPTITASMKPGIIEYNKGNYVGAMLIFKDVVSKERKNDYAKYYLANCYSFLGYKNEAQTLYREVVDNQSNYALTYNAQRAIDCIDNPLNPQCQPPKRKKAPSTEELAKENNTESETTTTDDDITQFIKSGQKIHPAAMDRITTERMIRRVEEEQLKAQEQQNR